MTPSQSRNHPRSIHGFSKPGMDPAIRRLTYGRIKPMDSDLTWWERLFRR